MRVANTFVLPEHYNETAVIWLLIILFGSIFYLSTVFNTPFSIFALSFVMLVLSTIIALIFFVTNITAHGVRTPFGLGQRMIGKLLITAGVIFFFLIITTVIAFNSVILFAIPIVMILYAIVYLPLTIPADTDEEVSVRNYLLAIPLSVIGIGLTTVVDTLLDFNDINESSFTISGLYLIIPLIMIRYVNRLSAWRKSEKEEVVPIESEEEETHRYLYPEAREETPVKVE